ncbi:MAG: hypothetical protein PUG00_04060 [Clostridiales bacterium]|nr:hypothetical protein [Clostridiales bacterium]
MPGLNKRELTSKPLRMDSRMARDIEKLSSYTGYSQNEIILMSIKRYLFENRQYFLRDMVEEKCISRIEKEVTIMHGESHLKYGDMTVDIEKTDNEKNDRNIYRAVIKLRNKLGEVFYEDEQTIDMSGKDWEYYKEFLYEVVMKYMDIDEPALKTYFREKFLYE